MEELMRNLYLFLTEAERGDVLRIHVTETNECYEFTYDVEENIDETDDEVIITIKVKK